MISSFVKMTTVKSAARSRELFRDLFSTVSHPVQFNMPERPRPKKVGAFFCVGFFGVCIFSVLGELPKRDVHSICRTILLKKS